MGRTSEDQRGRTGGIGTEGELPRISAIATVVTEPRRTGRAWYVSSIAASYERPQETNVARQRVPTVIDPG